MADTKFIIHVKTAAIFLAALSLGMTMSVIGPTMLDLQCTVNATYEEITHMLSIRSAGFTIGCLMVGVLSDRINQLLTFFVSLTMMGVSTILTPWATSLVTLLTISFFGGFGAGVVDPSSSVFILHIWGKESQTYLLVFHFAFGVGGLVAPLVASPFLLAEEAPAGNVTSQAVTKCHRQDLRIDIPYAILGGCCLLLALVFAYLFWFHRQTDEHPSRSVPVEEKMAASVDKSLVRSKWAVVILTAVLLFTLMSIEVGMGSFISSFAVKSDHHLSGQTGAYITSLYWLMYTSFRLISIPIIKQIGIHRNIIMALVILVICNMFLVPFGNSVEWCLWVGVSLAGIGISTVYASLFVLLEGYFPVTGEIVSFLTMFACAASWVYPLVMGYAMDTNPQLFLWLLFICTAVSCFLFAILSFLFLPRLLTKKDTLSVQAEANPNQQPLLK
ncbi:Major facilitator superfamily domain-containing protein 4A [Halotydeus destructor]|nr:Major facilitator superfamily domain-containing protein 4A [Halotydeus destructor]